MGSPGPAAFFVVVVAIYSHYFKHLFLSQPFVTQDRPGSLKFSINMRQPEDREVVGEVCPEKAPKGPTWLQKN